MGLQDLGQQDGRHSLRCKQAHPDSCYPEDQSRTIKIEETVKFLDVIFDQGLTWAAHINYIID